MVMASQEPAMPETGMKPVGDFSWHELATTNVQAAFDFYRALFGWEVLDRLDMGPSGIYLIFGWGGQQRGGIYNKTAEMTWPSNWLSYARVPNADAAAAQARGIGGKVTMGPMDVPGGDRIAVILDPQGATFAVHATKAEAKKPEAPKKVSAKKPAVKKAPAKKAPARKAVKKTVKKAARKAPKKVARKSGKKAAKSQAGRAARTRRPTARRPRRAK
jgi:predicted enzyme related to lactoylglutathione lyase